METTYLMGYLALVFGAAFACSMLLLRFGTRYLRGKQLERFADGARAPARPRGRSLSALAKLSRPLARFAMPAQDWQKSALPTRFLNAGVRNAHAPMLYFGAKTVLAVALPGALALMLALFAPLMSHSSMMFCLIAAAAAGFYAPNLIMARMVRRYQRAIFVHFPDALDLLTVCLEAGLAMDAAIARVAQEMAIPAPAMSDELQLVTLDLRAGNSRAKALRNLATRTGVAGVETLVSMLVQAERFGTSSAASLREHAQELRSQRRQQAEERAAKIALKLLFPLIFCIFPALLLVLLGPAMVQIYRALLPALAA